MENNLLYDSPFNTFTTSDSINENRKRIIGLENDIHEFKLKHDIEYRLNYNNKLINDYYKSIIMTDIWYQRCKEWANIRIKERRLLIEQDKLFIFNLKNNIKPIIEFNISNYYKHTRNIYGRNLEEYCYYRK